MSLNKPSFFSQIPSVVLNLIIINGLFWLGSIILPAKFGLNVTDILGMHYWESDKFYLYQLVSYMFMHDTSSISHLFFNMFGLYMFGRILEQVWGSKKFLLYYMATGVGAAIVQQLFWTVELWDVSRAFSAAIAENSGAALISQEGFLSRYFRFSNLEALTAIDLISMKTVLFNLPVTVGASGAVFGILLAFGWLFPDIKLVMIFFPVPIRARVFVILYGLAELFLGVANYSGDSVAHFAHLGGMIFGVLLLLYWRKKGVLYRQ
ncbi:MAG TPA: rhomboid family intramembrane serine protease [Paludibacteraceae bacterium]|nr:rhomboid family intramembrane serine protease [Paludibacteraceae bacterium]HQB68512.1 rhomboid family intramembrane serine protease [Paludibacteraceae bacterium]HRS67013.1 rhomboid family intramembrane serine protease [Paludibacteraceae bacterium]